MNPHPSQIPPVPTLLVMLGKAQPEAVMLTVQHKLVLNCGCNNEYS